MGPWVARSQPSRTRAPTPRVTFSDVRRGAYLVEEPTFADLARVETILDRYRDLRVGYVDAVVLAVASVSTSPSSQLWTIVTSRRPRHVEALNLVPA